MTALVHCSGPRADGGGGHHEGFENNFCWNIWRQEVKTKSFLIVYGNNNQLARIGSAQPEKCEALNYLNELL